DTGPPVEGLPAVNKGWLGRTIRMKIGGVPALARPTFASNPAQLPCPASLPSFPAQPHASTTPPEEAQDEIPLPLGPADRARRRLGGARMWPPDAECSLALRGGPRERLEHVERLERETHGDHVERHHRGRRGGVPRPARRPQQRRRPRTAARRPARGQLG